MTDYLLNFIDLFTESAPWLLLGLLIAGFMKWLVPMELLQKHMGDNRLSSILKATFIGAPLPLCSCGVIPAAIGLRRAGASKPATVAFLVSTPETGVDSISVSYALLGPFFAIIRPISAISTAIYAGLLVKFFALNDNKEEHNLKTDEINTKTTCCNPNEKKPEIAKSCCDQAVKVEKISCCTKEPKKQTKPETFELFKQSLEFSSGKLLSDITKWLLIGLLLAAAIKTWVSADFLTQWGDGLMAMVVMAVVGIPMYICATASTPLAAGFLAAGLSPGAVLVFMLAGPATNIATMGMIKQEMGTSVLVAYLFSLFTASIGFGYLTNWLIDLYQISIPIVAGNEHVMNTSIIYILSALLLLALMIRNLIKKK